MMDVKKNFSRFGNVLGITLMTAFGAGTASADVYNLILKIGGTPITCNGGGTPTGSFNFTKGAGSTAAATIVIPTNCLPTLTSGTYSGNVAVVVENVASVTGDDQGANVRGVDGTLIHNSIAGASISLSYAPNPGQANPGLRSFTSILNSTDGAGQAGLYYPFNVIGTAPEPETLALIGLGLGLLFAIRRRSRRVA